MDISYVFPLWLILEANAQFPFFGRSYNGPRAVEVPRMYSGRGIGQYQRREAGAIQTSDRRAAHGGLAPSYPQEGFRYRQRDGYTGNGVGGRSAYSGRTQDYGQIMDNGYDRRAPYSQGGNGYVDLTPSSWRESGGRSYAQRVSDQGRFQDSRGSSFNGRLTTNIRPRSYDNRDSFSNSDSFGSRPFNTFGRRETVQRRNRYSAFQGDRTAANSDSRYRNRPIEYQSNTNNAYSREDYRNSLPQQASNGNQYSRHGNHQMPVQRQITYQNVDSYRNSRGWHQQSNRELPRPGANQPRYRDNQPRIRDNLHRTHDNLPRTRDNQPLTRDNLPRTRDIQPRIRDSQPRTRDIQPRIRDSQPRTRDIQPRIRDSQPRIRDSEPRFRQHGQHNVQREWPTGGRPQSTINQRQTQQVATNYRSTINEPLYGRSVWRHAKSATPAVNQPFAGQSRWQSTDLNSRTGHNSLRTPNIDTLVREVDNSFPRFRGERNEVFQYRTAVQRTPGGTGSTRRGDFTGEPVSSLQLPFERLSLRYPNFVETQRKKLQESLRAQSAQRQRDSGRVQPPGLDLLGRRYESPARATSSNTVHVVVADMDDDKSGLVGLASTREQLIADITRTLGMAEQLQIDINSLGDPDWTVQSNTGTRGSSAPPTRTGGTEPGNVNFIFIDEPYLSDYSEGGTNVTSIQLDRNHSNTSDVVGSIHLDHHQPFFLESGNDGYVPTGDDESSLLTTQVENGD